MQHCPSCQVRIAGNKRCCPLCGGPLEGKGNADSEIFPALDSGRATGRLILKILALTAVCITAVCVLVNIAMTTQVWWSLFVAAGMLCAFLTSAVGIAYRKDIIQNIGWQVALLSVLSILWDVGVGWLGWSLDFVLPCVCVAGLLIMLLLAVLLHLPLQSFAGSFCAVCALGIVPGILACAGRLKVILPSLICTGLSIILLSTLIIFHWQTFKGEMSRRFHL